MTSFDELSGHVWSALRTLYTGDRLLFVDSARLPEEALKFRFAHYLALKIENSTVDSELRVDCEYRRLAETIKGFSIVDENGSPAPIQDSSGLARIAPDVIAHRRTKVDRRSNLLVIECKTASDHRDRRTRNNAGRRVDTHDDAKLRLLTGGIDPSAVQYVNEGFRFVEDASQKAEGTYWVDGSPGVEYQYGASVLFAKGGTRIAWYSGCRTDPFSVELAHFSTERGLVRDQDSEELPD